MGPNNKWPGSAPNEPMPDGLVNAFWPRLNEEEFEYIATAVKAGCSISALGRLTGARAKDDVNYTARGTAAPRMSRLNSLGAQHSVFIEAGVGLEWIDIDCKNGAKGYETFAKLERYLPPVFSEVATPSGGMHLAVPATGLPAIRFGGIDVQGLGTGVFAPGSNRGKYPGKRYRIVQQLRVDLKAEPSQDFRNALLELKAAAVGPRPTLGEFPSWRADVGGVLVRQEHLAGPYSVFSKAQHFAGIAVPTTRNRTVYNQAFTAACYIGKDRDGLTRLQTVLLAACQVNGLLAEDGADACLATINSGINDALDSIDKGGE